MRGFKESKDLKMKLDNLEVSRDSVLDMLEGLEGEGHRESDRAEIKRRERLVELKGMLRDLNKQCMETRIKLEGLSVVQGDPKIGYAYNVRW